MADNIFKDFVRFAALMGVLMAGSCAAPTSDANGLFEDGAVNHPITVEPSYRALELSFSPGEAGLMPQDTARFEAFIMDYRTHGNGAIAVSAPAGPGSSVTIGYFAERIASMGVSRDRILVATHDAPAGGGRVELNYVSYEARTDKCGNWSVNLANTEDNQTAPDFGCSVQQNIAAMVADPRDLIQPRDMSEGDAARRAVVLDDYEQGKPTAASKTPEQSGAISDVDKQ